MHFIKSGFIKYFILGIFLSTSCFSLTVCAAPSSSTEPAQLKRVVMLFRHGIRVPYIHNDGDINNYSQLPWPTWPVAPNLLTPHGFKLVQGLGTYFRNVYDKPLNLSQQGCKAIDVSRSRTDNVERTKQTGNAFLKGLLPECTIDIPSASDTTKDLYFYPIPAKVCTPNHALAYQQVKSRIGSYQQLLHKFSAPIALLQSITGCCHASLCKKDTSGSCTLLDLPGGLQENGILSGPFNVSQTLIESIYLEKAEGFPSKEVGWGKVDDTVIAQLDPVHITSHELMHRTPYLAQTQGSSLATVIFASIKEATQKENVPPLVLLVGHDNNIDNIGALYGLNWLPKTYGKNQVPPASCLVFELYYYPQSKEYRVKSYFVTQTLDEMANSQLASQETPPEWIPVQNDKCTSNGPSDGCPYEEWSKLIQGNLNRDCIPEDLQPVLDA